VSGFAARLLRWHARHGRHDLPWSVTRDPYRVWLSEIMLQQTQVATVIPYYTRFVAAFPSIHALARAPQAKVLRHWAGLGYYARARNLHACARRVVREHGGRFPDRADALAELPGIGRSTAAAIAAFCFGERAAILDGNVKRVLARHFGVEGFPGTPAIERRLWTLAQTLLPPRDRMPAYTQAVMDLGATVCTRRAPACESCPVRTGCIARRDGRVDQLPTPRAAQATPVRRHWWLLPIAQGFVRLERRPAQGVWGGLLAPMQFTSRQALNAAAKAMGGTETRALAERRHAFTHFTLRFTPVVVKVAKAKGTKAEWLHLSAATTAELPTPVKKLLLDLTPARAERTQRAPER
jgi:A/G-specific adenine glycosylase